MPDEGTSTAAPLGTTRFAHRLKRAVLLTFVPVALAGAGAYYYLTSGRYVSTENAYVKLEKLAISTDVSGHVAHVAVGENDPVKTGQILFRLDKERYEIALSSKEAEYAAARQAIEALRAVHDQKTAELNVASHNVAYYKREFDRSTGLQKKGHVSQSQFDRTKRDWLMAQQEVEAIRQEMVGVRASLGGDLELPIDQHPRVREARAERDRAHLDLTRTTVLAPQSGIVSNIELQVGEYVTAGTPVFSIVGADRVWIEANLKETELTHLREGQDARIKVDAYPDHTWRATVTGIGAATGAEFALLPPQNASGNWVKVVQRIPVRLEPIRRPEDPPLRAGMSVEVEIDTRHERTLPSLFDSALAWVRGER